VFSWAQQDYEDQQAMQQEAYEQQVAQEQYAAPGQDEDMITQLERLGALKDQGILTEDEFAAQKAKLLGI